MTSHSAPSLRQFFAAIFVIFSINVPSPASAGGGGVNIDALQHALQSTLEAERKIRDFPGATAAFILPDGRTGNIAVGFADQESRLVMQPDSRMPAGSIGKTFVAALTLALVEDNKLSLDDKLSAWLGEEEWYSRLANAKTIRIRNLLNHSAGIGEHVQTKKFGELVADLIESNPNSAIEPRDLVMLVVDAPPLFPAGEGYAYTDTGYILLQLAMEKAGAFEVGEETVRRFIYPLQLLSTSPAVGRLHAGLAQGYLAPNGLPGLPATTLQDGIFRWNPVSEWAGGGFISDSMDLARWARALYTARALPAAITEQLTSIRNLNTAPDNYAYGLGVVISQSPDYGRQLGHNGVYPGYRSSVAYYADCGVTIAFQINTDMITGNDVSEISRALAAAVLTPYGCSADVDVNVNEDRQ